MSCRESCTLRICALILHATAHMQICFHFSTFSLALVSAIRRAAVLGAPVASEGAPDAGWPKGLVFLLWGLQTPLTFAWPQVAALAGRAKGMRIATAALTEAPRVGAMMKALARAAAGAMMQVLARAAAAAAAAATTGTRSAIQTHKSKT